MIVILIWFTQWTVTTHKVGAHDYNKCCTKEEQLMVELSPMNKIKVRYKFNVHYGAYKMKGMELFMNKEMGNFDVVFAIFPFLWKTYW